MIYIKLLIGMIIYLFIIIFLYKIEFYSSQI